MAELILKSKSAFQTKKFASFLAKEIVKSPAHKTLVLALEGNLGSGKTTFTQGFAPSLGVKENVLSPTFVLMKIYEIKRKSYKHLIHIDCYRVESPRELSHLGFKKILKDKDAIILIEWADRIKKLIPRDAVRIKFKHGNKKQERIIKISNL